jgi:hypothetical protein
MDRTKTSQTIIMIWLLAAFAYDPLLIGLAVVAEDSDFVIFLARVFF